MNKKTLPLLFFVTVALLISLFTIDIYADFPEFDDPYYQYFWTKEHSAQPTANTDEILLLEGEDIIFIDETDYCEVFQQFGCKCKENEELGIRNEELKEPPKPTAETPVNPAPKPKNTTQNPVVNEPKPETKVEEVTNIPEISEILDEEIPNSSLLIPNLDEEIPNSSLLTPNSTTPLINPQGGNATMIESAKTGDVNREFIAVQTKNGAVFYIVIDRDEDEENVYFLNLVDEFDLQAFAKYFPETDDTDKEIIVETPIVEEPVQAAPVKEKSNSTLPILVILGVVGVIVYFKFFKGKNADKVIYDNDEDEDENDDLYENENDNENEEE